MIGISQEPTIHCGVDISLWPLHWVYCLGRPHDTGVTESRSSVAVKSQWCFVLNVTHPSTLKLEFLHPDMWRNGVYQFCKLHVASVFIIYSMQTVWIIQMKECGSHAEWCNPQLVLSGIAWYCFFPGELIVEQYPRVGVWNVGRLPQGESMVKGGGG